MYSAALIPCFFPSRIIFTLTMSYIFIVVSSLCVRKNTVQKSRHRQVSQPSMAERRHSQLSFAPPRTHCFTYSRDVFECFQLFFPSSSRSLSLSSCPSPVWIRFYRTAFFILLSVVVVLFVIHARHVGIGSHR